MNHNDLRSRGRTPHYKLDEMLNPGGTGYVVDDVLALESNLHAPSVGTAPSAGAFLTNYSLYDFPDNVTRYLQSAVQLPHSYKNGSDLLWHVHFTNASSIASGATVVFKAEVTFATVYGTFSTPVTYTSTFTAGSTTAANSHCLTTSVSVPVTGMSGSGFVLARIYRDTTDTHTGSVFLLGSDYHIHKSRFGSASENPTI